MRPDPDYAAQAALLSEVYDAGNYERGLAAFVLRRGHVILDRMAPAQPDARIIEVGAGTGVHLKHVTKPFASYLMTDASADMLAHARRLHADRPGLDFAVAAADRLDFPDASFDRLIATHVLEHLPEPHRVLREWARVVRPGGFISLILPSDPGMAWRLGRSFGPRRKFEAAGLAYDFWMAREHINAIFNLVTFVDYYFADIRSSWWPLRLPLPDLNLLYIAHLKVGP